MYKDKLQNYSLNQF